MSHRQNIIELFRKDGIDSALHYDFQTRSSTSPQENCWRTMPASTLNVYIKGVLTPLMLVASYLVSRQTDMEMQTLLMSVGTTLAAASYVASRSLVHAEALERRVE